MRNKVRVSNLHKRYKLNEPLAKKVVLKILKLLKIEDSADLEFIFVGDKAMKIFNKRYKGRNAPTDVLSFKIDRRGFGQKIFLGEIIISLDTAFKNAKAFGASRSDEIALYIIHGILHLFGYDDEDAEESRRMSKKQDLILGSLRTCKNLSKALMPL